MRVVELALGEIETRSRLFELGAILLQLHLTDEVLFGEFLVGVERGTREIEILLGVLDRSRLRQDLLFQVGPAVVELGLTRLPVEFRGAHLLHQVGIAQDENDAVGFDLGAGAEHDALHAAGGAAGRSEEHTSELQSH